MYFIHEIQIVFIWRPRMSGDTSSYNKMLLFVFCHVMWCMHESTCMNKLLAIINIYVRVSIISLGLPSRRNTVLSRLSKISTTILFASKIRFVRKVQSQKSWLSLCYNLAEYIWKWNTINTKTLFFKVWKTTFVSWNYNSWHVDPRLT